MENQKRPRGRPKSQFKDSSAGTLQSLDRALVALTDLAQAERATLSDLSRRTDIPTATLHRILMTLQAHRFATFDEDRQEWSVGIEAFRTGAAFLKRSSVLDVGRPFMRGLMQATGETANLAVPDGPSVVFVGQVETTNPIRAFFAPGTRTSMHASGAGKAILAAMAPAVFARTLAAMPLTAFTDNTLTDPDSLGAELDRIRAQGWSFDREERYSGMSCVGAVIFDETQAPCAGISVSGPSVRFDADHVQAFGRQVADAAQQITRLIGGTPPQ